MEHLLLLLSSTIVVARASVLLLERAGYLSIRLLPAQQSLTGIFLCVNSDIQWEGLVFRMGGGQGKEQP